MLSTKEAWTQRSRAGSLAEYGVPAAILEVAFAAGNLPETGRCKAVRAVLDRALGNQRVCRLQEQGTSGGEEKAGLAHHHPGHRIRAEEPGVRGRILQRKGP